MFRPTPAFSPWLPKSLRNSVRCFGPTDCRPDRSGRQSVGPKQRTEFRKLFGNHGEKAGVGRNIHTLVKEIEHLWTTEEARERLWAHYKVPYRHSNQILHSGPTAAGAATAGATEDALHMWIGASEALIPQALLSAYWIYGQQVSLVVDTFRVSSREAF